MSENLLNYSVFKLRFKSVHCIQRTDSLENYRIDIPSFFSQVDIIVTLVKLDSKIYKYQCDNS